MKYFNAHFNSLIRRNEEPALLVGVAGGRVDFFPTARWLYSLRIFLLFFRFEILWTTGEKFDHDERIIQKVVRT